jgi:sulfatase modifying factor 1
MMKTKTMRFGCPLLIVDREYDSSLTARIYSVLSLLASLTRHKWKILASTPVICLVGLMAFNSSLPAAGCIPQDFSKIPGGEFTIGSPESEVGRQKDEIQHRARVSDFYMSKYAVTVAEFRKFIEASNYQTDAEKGSGSWIFYGVNVLKKAEVNWRHGVSGSLRSQSEDNHPVLHVSWNDAVAYCQWISQKTGRQFRLPTGAEREYACRAGSQTPFNTGENITTDQANYDGNYPYNHNKKGAYRGNTVAVDSFAPNTWGLYNMHGNVLEWCSDWYGLNYYADCKTAGTVINPVGPATGLTHVLRGGSWNDFARRCRSASRDSGTPEFRSNYTGFRLVFEP